MKQFLMLLFAFIGIISVKANDSSVTFPVEDGMVTAPDSAFSDTENLEVEKNNWGGKLIKSPFEFVQNQYMAENKGTKLIETVSALSRIFPEFKRYFSINSSLKKHYGNLNGFGSIQSRK